MAKYIVIPGAAKASLENRRFTFPGTRPAKGPENTGAVLKAVLTNDGRWVLPADVLTKDVFIGVRAQLQAYEEVELDRSELSTLATDPLL